MAPQRPTEPDPSSAPKGLKLGAVLGVLVLCAVVASAAWFLSYRQPSAGVGAVPPGGASDTMPVPATSVGPLSEVPAPLAKGESPVQTRPMQSKRAPGPTIPGAADGSARARRPAVTFGKTAAAARDVLQDATAEFSRARTLFDREDYADASAGFERVMDMVEHEQNLGPDLYRVAGEFAAISRERAARDAGRLFTENDADVVAPVMVGSLMPAQPAPGTPTNRLDVLEVVIDAKGDVEKARLISSTHHYRNRWWVSAAKSWRFQPATKDGRPVRFVTRIPIADGAPP